jgi:hypothetical protein
MVLMVSSFFFPGNIVYSDSTQDTMMVAGIGSYVDFHLFSCGETISSNHGIRA